MTKERLGEAGGSEQDRQIEEALAGAKVPEEYQGFAKSVANLPRSDRNDQLLQMAAADQNFAGHVDEIASFFSAYDAAYPQEHPAVETAAPEEPWPVESAPEISHEKSGEKLDEWEENLGIEVGSATADNVSAQEIRDTFAALFSEWKDSGKTAREVIGLFLDDPELVDRFAEDWEKKYGAVASQEKEGAPPAKEDQETAGEKRLKEVEERAERFEEARHELETLAAGSASEFPRNALDVLGEVGSRPLKNAEDIANMVHYVATQRQSRRISKYHAAIILHALDPRFLKPEDVNIKHLEPGDERGEDIPEEKFEPETAVVAPSGVNAGKPTPGRPEGYVPRDKRTSQHKAGTLDDSLGRWEGEGGQVATSETGSKEEAVSVDRQALDRRADRILLDQRLRTEIESRRSVYRDLFGDKEAREEILDSGPDGMDNFLRRLDAVTAILSTESEALKKRDLIITARKRTGITSNSIYVNVEDLASGDLVTVRELADRLKAELASAKEPEAPPERRERATPEERAALDRQLREEINLRRNAYWAIRSDDDAYNEILDSGPAGMKNFLRRLDMVTATLLFRPGVSASHRASELLEQRDLFITTGKETGVINNTIYINVEDLASGNLDSVHQLADKLKTELTKAEGSERATENPEGTEPDSDGRPENLYDLQEQGVRTGRRGEDERTFVARARERVAETASRLAERFGIKNLADSARIAYSSELADWHTRSAVRLKGKMDDKRRKVADLEENRRHLEEEFNTFHQEGEVSARALMRIEKERASVEKDIEKNKNRADRLQSRLEYRNNQRARFENRRDEICRSYMDRVSERLSPFEQKLSDLKLTQEQLNAEINHNRESVVVRQVKLAELRKLAEAEKLPSIRRAYREIIKKIERETRDFTREITAREKDRGKINKKIVQQDKKANPWRDKYNRLVRIVQRRGPDTSSTPKRREYSPFETRGVSGHPATEEEDGEISGERHPETEKRYSGEALVEAWNSVNGSRMRINLDVAKKNFPTFFGEQESASDFLRFAEFYAEQHGDEERFEGMPSMQKAARKRRGRGFWAQLFGRGNRGQSQSRLLAALNRRK